MIGKEIIRQINQDYKFKPGIGIPGGMCIPGNPCIPGITKGIGIPGGGIPIIGIIGGSIMLGTLAVFAFFASDSSSLSLSVKNCFQSII